MRLRPAAPALDPVVEPLQPRPVGGQRNGFEKAHNTSRDPAGYVPANLIAYRDSKDFKVGLSEP